MTSEIFVDATGKPIDALNSVLARAFWGLRRDDAPEVAQRLITCMNRLVQINDADRWMLCGAEDNGLLDEPYENEQQVQGWVQGRMMTGWGRPPEPKPEWGFLLRMRIMRGNDTVLMPDANVGDYDGSGNNFTLDGSEWISGYRSDIAAAHVKALTESWSPDWAVWHTYFELEAQQADADNIEFGPVTYIAGIDAAQLSAHLPDTAHATALHDGTLITLDDGPQDYRYDDIYLVRDAVQHVRGTLKWR